MAEQERVYNCKKCGSPLEWIDTYETDADLNDNTFRIREFHHCDKCNITYNVYISGDINPTYIELIEG